MLLEPVTGLGAKLDFDLDLAAVGVLPVRVIINNVTPRTYRFDPDDIVLVQSDGARVHPISVGEAARRIGDVERQKATAESARPSSAEVTQRLQTRLLTGRSVAANQTLKGYLYYPLASYVKGRVTLEDQESEESEGFVVQF